MDGAFERRTVHTGCRQSILEYFETGDFTKSCMLFACVLYALPHDDLFCFPSHIAFIYLQPFMQRSYIINHTKSDRHGPSCITFLWSSDSHPMNVAHAGVNNMENTSMKWGAHNKSTDAITFVFYQFFNERSLFVLYLAYKSIKWGFGLLDRCIKISKQNRQDLFKSRRDGPRCSRYAILLSIIQYCIAIAIAIMKAGNVTQAETISDGMQKKDADTTLI